MPLAHAHDHLEGRKQKIEKDIEKAHDHLDNASAELEAATDALLAARAELAQAQAHLARTRGELAAAEALDARMQQRLDDAVARLHRARQDLDAGRQKVAEQQEQVSAVVVASYEIGSPDLMGLSVVLNSQDPTELTSRLGSVQSMVDRQEAVLGRLEASKVLLTVQEDEIERAKLQVAKERRAAAANLRRKQALEQQAEAAQANVSAMVSLRSQARSTALRAKRADQKELKKLQAERDRVAQLIAARASSGSGYTGPSTGNGFLSYPVAGSITSPYGWRTHPIWGYRSLHDGIDFGAGCGVPVRAAASGVVLERYYQTAYGNRVIVDHGVNHGVGVATIYNHLNTWTVSPGERVDRGEVVGYNGNTGWSTGCHLHFSVLENGRAVDPMKWL